MKTRLQELRVKYWNNRPAQERKIIAIATSILFPFVFYYLLWQPSHHAVAKLQDLVPTLQAQAIKLQQQAAEIDALRHRPVIASLDAQSLKSSISESASRHQLLASISTLESQEPNGARLTCESIPFVQWMTWLRALEQEQHIRADSVSISALSQTGMVKISATLTNGSALN